MVPLRPAGVVAQESAPSVSTTIGQRARSPSLEQQLPALRSGSGRFSTINPPYQVTCHVRSVAGRVLSSSLIYMRDDFYCDNYPHGFQGHGMLVNVELGDAAKMIPGTSVIVQASS
jgi:hypothetical protein